MQLLRSFVPCPPDDFISECGEEKDPYTFMMGATDEEEGNSWEQPRHEVRLSPFQMMTTPVTRQQYALFDPHHERHHREDLARRQSRAGLSGDTT